MPNNDGYDSCISTPIVCNQLISPSIAQYVSYNPNSITIIDNKLNKPLNTIHERMPKHQMLHPFSSLLNDIDDTMSN